MVKELEIKAGVIRGLLSAVITARKPLRGPWHSPRDGPNWKQALRTRRLSVERELGGAGTEPSLRALATASVTRLLLLCRFRL